MQTLALERMRRLQYSLCIYCSCWLFPSQLRKEQGGFGCYFLLLAIPSLRFSYLCCELTTSFIQLLQNQ